MKKITFLFFLATCGFLNCFCQNQQQEEYYNFDFEKNAVQGKFPDGWSNWGSGAYTIIIDSTQKHSGQYSILIESPTEVANNVFWCIATSIPAIYKGSDIELKAFIKTENAFNPIGLMLRIDGKKGLLQFNNMQKKALKEQMSGKNIL